MQFCCWVLQHFFTRGAAVDQILRITLLSIKICPRTQCESEAMQNSTRKAWFNMPLSPLRTTSKQASKIWPLARGFLPYKRESKDYKSYNINKSIIEKYLFEKEMRGAAAPRTPRLKRKQCSVPGRR